MTSRSHDDDAGRRAFLRAVAREREAIAVHEQAALLHERTAARFERLAQTETGDIRSRELRQAAVVERNRARLARDRAGAARRRLAAEGVGDPSDAG